MDMSNPIQEPAAPPAVSTATPPGRDDGLVDSLVRLGVGGVSLGARMVRQPLALMGELAGQGADTPPEATSDRVIETAVGAASGAGELARRGARTLGGLNRRVWRMTEPVRRPLDALGVTDLVQRPVHAVATRVETQVDTLQALGRSELDASRERVVSTLGGTIDGIIAYLASNPQVDALIRVQVDKLLPMLAEHPAVERLIDVQVDKILPKLAESAAIHGLIMAQVDMILPELAESAAIHDLIMAQVDQILPELAGSVDIQQLIRKQASAYLIYLQQTPTELEALIRTAGDRYIDYLNEHPEKVQNLVSGQSVTLAGQVLDEVRERTVTADSFAELLVRSILRKTPRPDLPEPADAVQRRATAAVLPSDYVHKKESGNGK